MTHKLLDKVEDTILLLQQFIDLHDDEAHTGKKALYALEDCLREMSKLHTATTECVGGVTKALASLWALTQMSLSVTLTNAKKNGADIERLDELEKKFVALIENMMN